MRHVSKEILNKIDDVNDLVRQGKKIEDIAAVTETVALIYMDVCDIKGSPDSPATILSKIQKMVKENLKVTTTINIFLQDCVNVVTTPTIVNFDSYFYLNNLTKIEGRLKPLDIRPVPQILPIASSDECNALILKLGITGMVSMLKLMLMIESELYKHAHG